MKRQISLDAIKNLNSGTFISNDSFHTRKWETFYFDKDIIISCSARMDGLIEIKSNGMSIICDAERAQHAFDTVINWVNYISKNQ